MRAEVGLSLVGARRTGEDGRSVEELLEALRALRGPGDLLQAFDARSVGGPRHVESAFLHARRAIEEGRAPLEDRGAVLALYLAGTDQFGKALARVGLSTDTRDLVIVASPPREPGPLLQALHLLPSPRAIPAGPSAETLKRLGIQHPGTAGGDPESLELRVLEHVALVDLGG